MRSATAARATAALVRVSAPALQVATTARYARACPAEGDPRRRVEVITKSGRDRSGVKLTDHLLADQGLVSEQSEYPRRVAGPHARVPQAPGNPVEIEAGLEPWKPRFAAVYPGAMRDAGRSGEVTGVIVDGAAQRSGRQKGRLNNPFSGPLVAYWESGVWRHGAGGARGAGAWLYCAGPLPRSADEHGRREPGRSAVLPVAGERTAQVAWGLPGAAAVRVCDQIGFLG